MRLRKIYRKKDTVLCCDQFLHDELCVLVTFWNQCMLHSILEYVCEGMYVWRL